MSRSSIDAIEFGQLYRPSAVLGAGDELPPTLRPEQWAGQSGTRVSHMWVSRDGEKLSTLDLYGRSWVLLAEDERWGPAAAQAGEALGIKLECLRVGIDVKPDDSGAFRKAFELGPAGASLVRPAGYVAWRSIDLPEDLPHSPTEALVGCRLLWDCPESRPGDRFLRIFGRSQPEPKEAPWCTEWRGSSPSTTLAS